MYGMGVGDYVLCVCLEWQGLEMWQWPGAGDVRTCSVRSVRDSGNILYTVWLLLWLWNMCIIEC